MRYLVVSLFVVVSFFVLVLLAPPALAEPVAYATRDGVTVTLHSEACAVKGIKNLPNRATWDEGGKRTEGCAGMFGPVVGLYFADQSMAVVSVELFQRFEPRL